jgi:hypothetical protein
MMTYALPADPMSRFVAIYEMLDAERNWFGDPSSLRSPRWPPSFLPAPSGVAMGIRRITDDVKVNPTGSATSIYRSL